MWYLYGHSCPECSFYQVLLNHCLMYHDRYVTLVWPFVSQLQNSFTRYFLITWCVMLIRDTCMTIPVLMLQPQDIVTPDGHRAPVQELLDHHHHHHHHHHHNTRSAITQTPSRPLPSPPSATPTTAVSTSTSSSTTRSVCDSFLSLYHNFLNALTQTPSRPLPSSPSATPTSAVSTSTLSSTTRSVCGSFLSWYHNSLSAITQAPSRPCLCHNLLYQLRQCPPAHHRPQQGQCVIDLSLYHVPQCHYTSTVQIPALSSPLLHQNTAVSTSTSSSTTRSVYDSFLSLYHDPLSSRRQTPSRPLTSSLPLGDDKVSMLTHTCPHKPQRKIKVTISKITRLTTHFLCGLMSDLVICKFWKSMVIHNTECP